MALSGPEHYRKADELLAEIEASQPSSNPAEMSLAVRAVAHALLGNAAAVALGHAQERQSREVTEH